MTCQFEPYGLIGDRWREEGGANSFGCPTGPDEYAITNEFGVSVGRRRDFANGQIAWSPKQGGRMLTWVYRQGEWAVFEWGPTDPFNYDCFLVRWSVSNGEPVPSNAQEQVDPDLPSPFPHEVSGIATQPRSRTGGYFLVHLPANRVGVSFIVQGCDKSFASPSDCRQGWTCPLMCRLPSFG